MIKVLFFAALKDAAGQRSMNATAQSVAELRAGLVNEFGDDFEAILDHCTVAVNSSQVNGDVTLNDDDTVAFLPPVSGG